MEGALNALSYSHRGWKDIGLTTPILGDIWQVMYAAILCRSRGIDEIWSRLSASQQTRTLDISFGFDPAWSLGHGLVTLATGEKSYLYHHTNKDETLVFVLCIDTPPPELESPDPILGSSQSTPMVGAQWPIEFIDTFEQVLLSADDEELLILSLKQADTDGKID